VIVFSFDLIARVAGCFLLGAIPFAKVAMWGTGIDITKVGSKNPGFNNVLRVSTKPRAAVALIGDISKGLLALLLLANGQPTTAQWLMGIAAVAGHCWSPFLGWNGGKGVATTVGVLLRLAFFITIACLPVYVLLRWFGRRMHWRQEGAISSLTTMFLLATAVLVARGLEEGLFAYAMLGIVVIRHAPNIREVIRK
jgi:acyl phosphate:glycerol-3-phosphate acyltransferase